MADQKLRTGIMKKVEELFADSCGKELRDIEQELGKLGFTETGADPAAIAFEHKTMELYLEIELDNARCVHGYFLVPFEEKQKKQRKFRW
jgi:hypothetical protein